MSPPCTDPEQLNEPTVPLRVFCLDKADSTQLQPDLRRSRVSVKGESILEEPVRSGWRPVQG